VTPAERRKRARQVETGGQLTAGSVGVGFGAAKLRDAYAEDYPDRFKRGVTRLNAATRGTRLKRVAQAVEHGRPHFKALALATAAGGTAAAAHRYQQLSGYRESKRKRSAFGVPI
jgi:hypothetical protein